MPCGGALSAPEEEGDDATADTMTGQRADDDRAGTGDGSDADTTANDDMPTSFWDGDRGEFRQPAARLSATRLAA